MKNRLNEKGNCKRCGYPNTPAEKEMEKCPAFLTSTGLKKYDDFITFIFFVSILLILLFISLLL